MANLSAVGAAFKAPTVPAAVAAPSAVPIRPANMREALDRQQALQSRADNLRVLISSARNAALAATRTQPTDGLSANGLDPIAAVRQAVALNASGDTAGANTLLVSVAAANDATGTNTWEGASAPVQLVSGGRTTVTIAQNQSRAILSWNKFDVGANTTVQFNQQSAGVAQPGWTVVNRVVNSIAPSTILGAVKADGTVFVINRAGVIFGQGSQVNLHSLLASTLDIGNFASAYNGGANPVTFVASTIKDRNSAFLQNGLLPPAVSTLPVFLVSTVYDPGTQQLSAQRPALEGSIVVDPGASISGTAGGFLILTAPTVTNAGSLTAIDGQVSLQGGRFITATASTGAANSIDVNVRGLILGTVQQDTLTSPIRAATADDGTVVNTGLIQSTRGYISLGADTYGSVTNAGLLAATTSVSRNGDIALIAGKVTLAGSADPTLASGLTITPDANGETIPQGTADAPPTFKTSQILIGARDVQFANASGDGTNLGVGAADIFVPGQFTMGQNAFIYAPSANVVIGRDASQPALIAGVSGSTVASGIDILAGATIDVSGVKDVQLDASRNSLTVTPVKRNELRDTPTYREVTTNGNFTLNGTTLLVDPRISGVRADGVAWVGSPLIEAASIASQIPVTAAELMTKGGNVSMGVNAISAPTTPDLAPHIRIAQNAVIDLSGGWVTYAGGTVRTSRLIAADGRIVDIAKADPNDMFVDVVNGFTAAQPRFGIADTYRIAALQGAHFEAAYDEGRDAGSLSINAPQITLDGTLFANGFAGSRQIADAKTPSFAASITADPRLLQRVNGELPAGGFVRIGSVSARAKVGLGGDMLVYGGTLGSVAENAGETLLNSAMLSNAGISALTLQTTGRVTFAAAGDNGRQDPGVFASRAASDLALAPGGTLSVDAGREIRFDGRVTAASGTITARTYELNATLSAKSPSFADIGSAFTSLDDLSGAYTPTAFAATGRPANPFDITVTGALSTAGRFVNDFTSGDIAQGAAWINGGSISLAVAPNVFVALTGTQIKGDLSGSIRINAGADLNVSAGAQVAANRALNLTGKGGNVSLINETVYASIIPGSTASDVGEVTTSNQSVDFTPIASSGFATNTISPIAVPANRIATVQFAPGTIRGFGLTEGGTFTLVAPDIAFGSAAADGPLATAVPLDFLATTGFGTLDITAYKSRIVTGPSGFGLFSNGRQGLSAFLDTTLFTIAPGEQLDLTQHTLLPSVLDQATTASLLSLASGLDVSTVLTPGVPAYAYDRKPAALALHGLAELDVNAGGSIVGAPGATIVAPKLLNAGSIVLPGGTISQITTLPVRARLFGVRDASRGGNGLGDVFGALDANGLYNEQAFNVAGFTNAAGRTLTNQQLLTAPGGLLIVFEGNVRTQDGIVLADGSVTDLHGVALFDPRAPIVGNVQLRQGRVLAGGSIGTATPFTYSQFQNVTLFSNPVLGNVRYLDSAFTQNPIPPISPQIVGRTFLASTGARIDVSGATGVYDVATSPIAFAPQLEWSNGGNVIVGAGGSLAGSTIDARGGAPAALGGTLDWTRPILRQSDTGTAASTGASNGAANNVVSADLITASGFDTLEARGGLTFDGPVSLSLRKALLIDSINPTQADIVADEATIRISATAGTNATVSAPYVRFASRLGYLPFTATALPGDAAVKFVAGDSGIDVRGALMFDASIAKLSLQTSGDLRLSGVDDRSPTDLTGQARLDGRFEANGDVTIDAARVYTTTGTGNLQRYLEAQRAGQSGAPTNSSGRTGPYVLTTTGTDATLTIRSSATNAAAPLSAGSYLSIQAANIVQDGHLAAPLGLLEIGTAANPAKTISFGAGSITSVSGAGLNVPYGTTTDQTEYYFTPGVNLPIKTVPTGQLTLSGGAIDVGAGALIDGRGGGDVFAFEFVSGTGGSRDILDRINRDVFSSNDYNPATGSGFQFADHRQVFAIVPVAQAARIALYDPIYSADYNPATVDLYGASAGLSVTLDGAGGVPAGQYLLLPAHYALLPGAYRVVENTDAVAPAPGYGQTLLDGSVVMGGTFSTIGTGFADSTRRSFTVQSQKTVLSYSQITTTGGSATVTKLANTAGVIRPALPIDAARVVLAPLTELKVAGAFDLTPAAGGTGAKVDILGQSIALVAEGARAVDGTINLTAATLGRLNAASLAIGALRTENLDATTTLQVAATTIDVQKGFSFTAPELLLAVGGLGSKLTVESGATLTAAGSLSDTRAGDYIITSNADAVSPYDQTGIGSVLRLASGVERLVDRQGDFALRNTMRPSTLKIGAATLQGATLTLDTSRNFALDSNVVLRTPLIALSSDSLQFGTNAKTPNISSLSAGAERALAGAQRLTLRSPDVITFAAAGYVFNDLTLDTPGIAMSTLPAARGTVSIAAGNVRIQNTRHADLGGCTASGARACGTAGYMLNIAGTGLTLGNGVFREYGFNGGLNLTATNGTYVIGSGTIASDAAPMALITPFIIDRAAVVDPTAASPVASDAIAPAGAYTIPVLPDYHFATTGAIAISAPAGAVAAAPAGIRAPGAHISFGSAAAPVASLTIAGTAITATAGTIDARSAGDVALSGTASLATPGYTRSFGDALSTTTVTGGGGAINLVSLTGNITAPAGTTLSVDNGVGAAGGLALIAGEGAITLGAQLDPLAAGARGATFHFDAGKSAFDFDSFAAAYGARFGGDISVHTGAGDLALGVGHTIRATGLSLTADGGAVTIAGRIDTSGIPLAGLTGSALLDARVNGGDIALYGMAGVTIAGTASLDTHTNGYADTDTRVASAGNVTIGIGSESAALTIAPGATIDLGARRTQGALAAGQTGNRLIPQIVKDPVTLANTTAYRFVEADKGGTLSLRAPILAGGQVDVRLGGTIAGAGTLQLEAFKTYDLTAIAATGNYSGISDAGGGQILLNLADTIDTTGLPNPLTENFSDGTVQSIPNFIQNFTVSARDGSSLADYRRRPGIVLTSAGDLGLSTNWNLAAVTVDQQGALAAGLLTPIPQLGVRQDDGTPYVAVVAGREGDLLASPYVNFLYHVGGKASGETALFTLRAAHDLLIQHSISDGFFTFRDKSDPGYINYQLGGGNRTYNPALAINCGNIVANDCSSAGIVDFNAGATPDLSQAVVITLNSVARGAETTTNPLVGAPFTAGGNGPAALGGGFDANTGEPSGDPLGFAELFPLLPDGSAIHSADVRLVGGAGDAVSANPLHVDYGSAGNVVVSGEGTYRVTATAPTTSYAGVLQFRFQGGIGPGTTSPIFDLTDVLNGTVPNDVFNVNSLSPNAYTVLNFSNLHTGPAVDARALAKTFFANRPSTFTFTKGANPLITSVRAGLDDIVAFLQALSPTYVNGLATGQPGYTIRPPSPPPLINFNGRTAYYGSTVRTGDGAISVAAAKDVSLLRDTPITYRSEAGGNRPGQQTNNAQVGGTAIYTAGRRVSASAQLAQVIGGGGTLAVTPDAAVIAGAREQTNFIPSPKNLTDVAAVVAIGGGAISINAGGSVVGRRDVYSEQFLGTGVFYQTPAGGDVSTYLPSQIGGQSQRWRVGTVGQDTEIAIAPRYFTSGVGALAGGDVSINAGLNVQDLTVALDTSVTTTANPAGKVLMTFGAGDLALNAGGSLRAGQIDVAHGSGTLAIGGGVTAFGGELASTFNGVTPPQYLRVRVEDGRVALTAQQAIDFSSASALGATLGGIANYADINNAAGFFSADAAFGAIASGAVTIFANRFDQRLGATSPVSGFVVLPPSLMLVSLNNEVKLPPDPQYANRQPIYLPMVLAPSRAGQLTLLSAGNLDSFVITMSDSDPSLLPGAFTAVQGFAQDVSSGLQTATVGLPFGLSLATPTTPDATLRLYHNDITTHLGDSEPFRIQAGVDILRSAFNMPKAGQIGAGRDIVDIFFTGQNVASGDATRIRSGRDITSTIFASTDNLPVVTGNNFVLGGPGSFLVEAGRNIGPFINSATVEQNISGIFNPRTAVDFAGGIRTVGNDLNPWLAPVGANLSVLYGVGAGVDYTATRERYVNPANVGALDGALFVQTTDQFGNVRPDRSKPIYATALVGWLVENAPDAIAAAFGAPITLGSGDVLPLFNALSTAQQQQFLVDLPYLAKQGIPSTTVAIDRRKPTAPVITTDAAAVAAAATANQTTISGATLVGWIAQNAPDVLRTRYGVTGTDIGAAYTAFAALAPLRQRDFLVNDVYFNELKQTALPAGASYLKYDRGYQAVATLFPPSLGYTDNLAARAAGTPAVRVQTGNADLRLATLETARGGDITILGPGGDFIAGSVVRTSEQVARRETRFSRDSAVDALPTNTTGFGARFRSVPIGFEGVITLRGGQIRSFTDGDFRVNQSRVFTVAGGDLTMWSSNGDLAAGQGPKSASNFPPVTVRFDPNGLAELNTPGSIAGAGIGAFKRNPADLASDIVLIAPVGLVDAGDAGVRASGNIFVAAARVANADNFSAGGSISGVPTGAATQVPVVANAASTITAQIARIAQANSNLADTRSLISVDILGYAGQDDPCKDPKTKDPSCKKAK